MLSGNSEDCKKSNQEEDCVFHLYKDSFTKYYSKCNTRIRTSGYFLICVNCFYLCAQILEMMKLDILAFGAHPDDVELSAAGTLMKQIDKGRKVGIVDMTQGELGSRGTVETRYEEADKASKIMGIQYRTNLKMEDGFFENNAENRLKVIEQIRLTRPEVLLINAPSDRHPDHGRAAQLVLEASFYAGLRMIKVKSDGIELEAYRPKAVYHYIQDRYLEPSFVTEVTPYVERKLDAIMAYSTQFYNPDSDEPQTPISGKDFLDFIRGRMSEMGRKMGVTYAEGFIVARTIGVDDIMDLL